MEYADSSKQGKRPLLYEQQCTGTSADLYVIDLDFVVRLVNRKWPYVFRFFIVELIEVLCALEFVLAAAAVLVTSSTVSSENLGAAIVDISCMLQITIHVHACLTIRSDVLPSLDSLLKVGKLLQESCNTAARRRMYRVVYLVRSLTGGTFITVAVCLIICIVLSRPASQTTPVATWPAPGPDMPITIAVVTTLQLYATVFGSVFFCIATSIHFGSILYSVALFSGLSSCIRNLHLLSDSAEIRYHQLSKYLYCQQSLLRAMLDVNKNCKNLLFTRISSTFAVLVYTGMSLSLGFVTPRVLWMTAFGFITLFQLTLTGQYLTQGAEQVAEALYETRWQIEGTDYRKILCLALQGANKPLLMSTWFCRSCDLPFMGMFVKQWVSSVQMMYKARVSRK